MMSILNTLICPNCGVPFPLIIRRSMAVRRGFLLSPFFRCSNCTKLSLSKVCWKRAILNIPLAVGIAGGLAYIFRTSQWSKALYDILPALYGLIIGLPAGLILGIGIRRSFRLIPIQSSDLAGSGSSILSSLLILAAIISIFSLYGFLTNQLMVVAAVGVLALIVMMWNYLFLQSPQGIRKSR